MVLVVPLFRILHVTCVNKQARACVCTEGSSSAAVLSGGAIAGIVIACIVVVALVVLLALFFVCRRASRGPKGLFTSVQKLYHCMHLPVISCCAVL